MSIRSQAEQGNSLKLNAINLNFYLTITFVTIQYIEISAEKFNNKAALMSLFLLSISHHYDAQCT